MFYYLNEPAEGGGTAFPFADNVTYDDSVRSEYVFRRWKFSEKTAIREQ